MSVTTPVPLPVSLASAWSRYTLAAERVGLPVDHWTLERHRDGSVHVRVSVPGPATRGGRRPLVVDTRSRIGETVPDAVARLESQADVLACATVESWSTVES